MDLLRQPRWIAGHLIVAVLVVLFVRLGFWQLDRHAQHVERNATIEARADAPPLGLEDLVDRGVSSDPEPSAANDAGPSVDGAEPDPSAAAPAASGEPSGDAGALAYRRVVLEGRLDAEHELLWRNHTHAGQPGWHVLTPLVASAGGVEDVAVLVDRGWVPHEMDRVPVDAAAPPSGPVRVEGVVLPEQDPPTGPLAGLAARDPADGPLERAFYVDVERLAPQMPYALAPVYVIATAVAPAPPGGLPVPPEPPAPGAASHLGYAIQWFAFALIGGVGYAVLLRHRLREHRAAPTASSSHPARP